jgi:hypothetical protein
MAKKLAEAECYMGPGEWTYRIEEVYDRRLGQVVYELHTTLRATGASSLVGEYNTRAQARDGMLRYQELHKKGRA